MQNNSDLAKKLFTSVLIVFAGIGGILYGYDIGVISGALLFIKKEIILTPDQLSLIGAAVLSGGAVATLFSGLLADWLGRRTMITISSIIFILGIFLLVNAHSYAMIIISRLIQGIGIGIVTVVVPLYLTESAPSQLRGRCIAAFQLFLTGGIVLAYLIDYFFAPSGNWRAMFSCVLIPAILFFIGSFLISESPRWLYRQNKKEAALKTMLKIQDKAQAELNLKEMEVLHLNQHSRTWGEAFRQALQRKYLIPFFIALAIALLNQLTGINSILQFSSLMLEEAGFHKETIAILASVGVGLINFLTTMIALFLIDKVGRKPLLMFGTMGITVSLFFSGLVSWLVPVGILKGYLLLIGLIIFIFFFAVGPGVVVWLALSEILPTQIRSTGMAICLFINSLASAALAAVFLRLADKMGYVSVFWLCGAFTLIYFLIARFLLPETKNKSLEEIEIYFEKG